MSLQSKGFDWSQVRKKLQQSQMSADSDRGRTETIYRERAARLASQRALPGASPTLGALVFTLGTERYAVDLRDLVEVLPFDSCTPVPGGPQELMGVINWRGAIRPVLSLALVLALPQVENPAHGWMLLLRKGHRDVGFTVDRVENIRMLRSEGLAVPTKNSAHPAGRYVKAITAETVMLLNTDHLLSLPVIKECQ
ncbi:MAG TPA: chemotaxis protein CheW [Bryobacteraceae bacterium]|nr:chemotaxis protein CheW [Bryobacteraceae bacterium]HXJ43153.1 chemotaxis protein CheW [Bryobacteraceae bacterium]